MKQDQIMAPSYFEKEMDYSEDHVFQQRRDKSIQELEKSIVKKLDYIYTMPWICLLCMIQVCVEYLFTSHNTHVY